MSEVRFCAPCQTFVLNPCAMPACGWAREELEEVCAEISSVKSKKEGKPK